MFRRSRRSICKSVFAFVFCVFCCQSIYAQVETNFSDLFPKPNKPSRSTDVDVEVTVNFWDHSWYVLFVQDGYRATFVQLPERMYQKPLDLRLGTRIRIQGWFNADDDVIHASAIEVLRHDDAEQPQTIKFDELTLGDHWSERVRCQGLVEAALVEPHRIQLLMRDGETRFAARIKRSFSDSEACNLVGSKIEITGTLCCLVDKYGRPDSFLCQSMSDDEFEILKYGPGLDPQEAKVAIGDFLDRRHDLNGPFVIAGQVSFIQFGEFFVVEDDDRNAVAVYGPFEGDLKIGDRVRVLARLPNETERTNPQRIPSLTQRYDARGSTADAVALLVFHEHPSVAKSALSMSAVEVLEQIDVRRRATLRGILMSSDSVGETRTLILEDDGIPFTVRFHASDESFDVLKLDGANELRVTGLVRKPNPNDTLSDTFALQLASVGDLDVLSRRHDIDRQTAIAIGGCLLALILGGLVLIWKLRRRFNKQQQNLANVIARLNSSYDAVREALLVVDMSGRIVGVNSKLQSILGIESKELAISDDRTNSNWVGQKLADRFQNPDAFMQSWNDVQQDPKATVTLEMSPKDEARRTIAIYSAPVLGEQADPEGRIWTFNDISERRQLEAKLVQSQKMEAVGRLAGGVAHDFNNLLLAISANIELTRFQSSSRVGDVDEYLGDADEAAKRASKLVKHLLGFSRKTNLDMAVHDSNHVVDRVRVLLERTLQAAISLRVDLDTNLWFAKFDEVQLEQVIVNICLNGRDAIGDQNGTITIETSNVEASTSPLKVDSVRIRISDDGSGMSEDVRQLIFDPFFTTKERGKGTGLGLAMSFGIIQQHGGLILCESKLNHGSTFDVFLRRCTEPKSEQSCPPHSNTNVVSSSIDARILVVDDESLVRACVEESLRVKGFQVLTAAGGEEALQILAEVHDVDLVLLDYSMPIMSGREVFQRIQQEHPSLPVIMCSGFLHELENVETDTGQFPVAVVGKPFQMDELVSVINSSLCNSSRRSSTSADSVSTN